MNYEKEIEAIFERDDYPAEARASLLRDYRAICADEAASAGFHAPIRLYEADQLSGFESGLNRASDAAATVGVEKYAAHLLALLCMTPHLKALYKARNFPDEMFRVTALDAKWKMAECQELTGIWGTKDGGWEGRFFELTRFGIGRLQFEPGFAPLDVETMPAPVRSGDVAIWVHIPSGGKLDEASCLASFRQAETFFRPLFGDAPVLFVCGSWLLYPEHDKILPAHSNIRRFMHFFKIVKSETTSDYYLWRIFHRADCSDYANLPRETGLQRAYADLLTNGGSCGGGTGYLEMKNGVILR